MLEVLSAVYKTYLTAQSGLRPVDIPQGISPEISAMLQLLNVTAEAPILTLDVDETTNSIVMRTPGNWPRRSRNSCSSWTNRPR